MDSLLLNEMKDACVAYAGVKGWSLLLTIRPRVDFWREAAWWPKMVDFIREYPISESTFDTWDRFSKENCNLDNEDLVASFKTYAIYYLGTQILQC